MEKLREEMEAFFAALYAEEKKVLVHGEGFLGARAALVGEAPGEQETLLRRPFVGKAGKTLDAFLAESGLMREELYVTNAVKFRPTKISAAGRVVNRPPTTEEIHLFLPWLKRELALVKPGCVVTLGNVPLGAVMGGGLTIGEAHGRFMKSADGFTVYPMYHPASLIYNPSLKETYAADMRRFADWLRGKNLT